MTKERRQTDLAILEKLDHHSDKLLIIDERQQIVLKRLDQINGTVADYNKNKMKFDQACAKVETLECNIVKTHEVLTEKVVANETLILQKAIEHEQDLKELDDRYIGKKLFTVLAAILSLIIIIFNVIDYIKP